MKIQGKSGIVKEISLTLSQDREKSGKTNLVHMQFSLRLYIIICKMIVPFVISKCELYHFT